MPSWVVQCEKCIKDFMHSKINDEKLTDFMEPRKPRLPQEGLAVKCPFCGHISVVHAHHLRYQS